MRTGQQILDGYNKTHGFGRWDMWVLDAPNFVLTNTLVDYEIDLERITSAADLFKWVTHMSGKSEVYGEDQVFELGCAFKAIYAYAGTKASGWDSKKIVHAYCLAEGKRKRCDWML